MKELNVVSNTEMYWESVEFATCRKTSFHAMPSVWSLGSLSLQPPLDAYHLHIQFLFRVDKCILIWLLTFCESVSTIILPNLFFCKTHPLSSSRRSTQKYGKNTNRSHENVLRRAFPCSQDCRTKVMPRECHKKWTRICCIARLTMVSYGLATNLGSSLWTVSHRSKLDIGYYPTATVRQLWLIQGWAGIEFIIE